MDLRMDMFLDYLKITNKNEIDKIFVQYEGDEPLLLIYPIENDENLESFNCTEQHISFEELSEICRFLTGLSFAAGVEGTTLYCNHREVKQLRAVMPLCRMLINYEDETSDIDFSETLSSNIRRTLTLI